MEKKTCCSKTLLEVFTNLSKLDDSNAGFQSKKGVIKNNFKKI